MKREQVIQQAHEVLKHTENKEVARIMGQAIELMDNKKA